MLNKKLTLVRKHNKQQSQKFSNKQLQERLEISCRNISYITKIDKYTKSLIKFIIFNECKIFEKISVKKKVEIFENFLTKTFRSDIDRLYFCSLIFFKKKQVQKKF